MSTISRRVSRIQSLQLKTELTELDFAAPDEDSPRVYAYPYEDRPVWVYVYRSR